MQKKSERYFSRAHAALRSTVKYYTYVEREIYRTWRRLWRRSRRSSREEVEGSRGESSKARFAFNVVAHGVFFFSLFFPPTHLQT